MGNLLKKLNSSREALVDTLKQKKVEITKVEGSMLDASLELSFTNSAAINNTKINQTAKIVSNNKERDAEKSNLRGTENELTLLQKVDEKYDKIETEIRQTSTIIING